MTFTFTLSLSLHHSSFIKKEHINTFLSFTAYCRFIVCAIGLMCPCQLSIHQPAHKPSLPSRQPRPDKRMLCISFFVQLLCHDVLIQSLGFFLSACVLLHSSFTSCFPCCYHQQQHLVPLRCPCRRQTTTHPVLLR